MISGLHIGTELRRFKRFRLSRLAIITLCVLPILYSTLYLWSFWNPFGEVNRVPVALVNSDRGATINGQQLNAGAQITQGLLDDKSLDWQKVSHQEAIDGVQNGRFYFALELPEDFSAAVTSAGQNNPNPERATLKATYNDANGYLSTVIGENAMRAVLNVVDQKIGSQAVDKLLVGLLDAGTGITRAANGAKELNNGLAQLEDGGNRLSDGAKQAVDGTNRLTEGTGQLRDGASQLKDGSGQLATGLDQLTAGTEQLAAGVNSASGTIDSVGTQADQLEARINEAGGQIAEVNRNITALQQAALASSGAQGRTAADVRAIANSLRALPDPGSQDAARRLNDLANELEANGIGPNSPTMQGINNIANAAHEADYQVNNPNSQLRGAFNQVDEGIKQFGALQDGVTRLNDGAHQLRDGAHRLDEGVVRLNEGVVRLDDGAKQLKDGSLQLSDGANQLRDGIVRAHDGSTQLSDGLRAGGEQIPMWSPTQRAGVASVMGGPVKVSNYNDSGSHTFGGGLAPFFFSIALYIGAIMMFFLIKPLQRRAVASGISPLRAAIDGFLSPGLIGLGQAVAVVGLTLLAVPLETATKWGLFGFAMLVSLMNVALIQMFNSVLPPGPGRVAAMAFLMIQLVSSGGLYPIETEPLPLQWLHPFMPMTYAVNGFRQIMYGAFDARLPIAIGAVVFFTVLAIAITSLAAARDRTWTMRRLHPAIQV